MALQCIDDFEHSAAFELPEQSAVLVAIVVDETEEEQEIDGLLDFSGGSRY